MVKQTISGRVLYSSEQMPQSSERANKGLVEFCLILICASLIDKINGISTFAPNMFLSRSIEMMNVSSSESVISNVLY